MILLILTFMLIGSLSAYMAGKVINYRRHIALKLILGALLGLSFFFILLHSSQIKKEIMGIGLFFTLFCDFVYSTILSIIILSLFKTNKADT